MATTKPGQAKGRKRQGGPQRGFLGRAPEPGAELAERAKDAEREWPQSTGQRWTPRRLPSVVDLDEERAG